MIYTSPALPSAEGFWNGIENSRVWVELDTRYMYHRPGY